MEIVQCVWGLSGIGMIKGTVENMIILPLFTHMDLNLLFIYCRFKNGKFKNLQKGPNYIQYIPTQINILPRINHTYHSITVVLPSTMCKVYGMPI